MVRHSPSFRELLAGSVRPLVGAHRGASADRPENTVAAFIAAAGQGADFWELDVRLSADGVPMVIHDATIDRTTSGRGPVRDKTASQLESYGVPALATVLAVGAADTLFNLELKTGEDQVLAAAVMAVTGGLGLDRRILVSSFDHALLAAVKRASAATLTGALYEEEPADPVGYARELRTDALLPRYRLANARLINAAREAGLFVVPWTVDKPSLIRYFAAAKAHGIITNKPGAAVRILGDVARRTPSSS